MITESEARKIVTMLQLNWPNYPFTPDSWKSWHKAMDDREYPAIEQAVNQAMKSEQFCPVPAVIRNIMGANGMSDQDESATEWANVKAEIRRVHVNHAPVFANEATEAATRAMGWPSLCLMEADDEIANRAHFFKIWAGFNRQIKQRKAHELASGVTPIDGAKPKAVAS